MRAEHAFHAPGFLLLLPLLAGGAVWLHRRSLAGLPPERRRAALVIRLVLLSLLTLALAEPVVTLPSRALAVLFILNRSASIPAAAREQQLRLVNAAARRLPPDTRAGVVVFGRGAIPQLELTAALSLPRVQGVVRPRRRPYHGWVWMGAESPAWRPCVTMVYLLGPAGFAFEGRLPLAALLLDHVPIQAHGDLGARTLPGPLGGVPLVYPGQLELRPGSVHRPQ